MALRRFRAVGINLYVVCLATCILPDLGLAQAPAVSQSAARLHCRRFQHKTTANILP
jgi:hypothetical protein